MKKSFFKGGISSCRPKNHHATSINPSVQTIRTTTKCKLYFYTCWWMTAIFRLCSYIVKFFVVVKLAPQLIKMGQKTKSFQPFVLIFSGVQQSCGLVGPRCSYVRNGGRLPAFLCWPTYSNLREDRLWTGKNSFKVSPRNSNIFPWRHATSF